MPQISLKKLLEEYASVFPEEALYRKEMLAFLEENENSFERSCLKGHFTASAWILNPNESAALLMHHAKLNIWVQLGGHCDGEPDVLAVALKEAKEESGIDFIESLSPRIFDIDIHSIPKHKEIPEHLHYDVRFLLKVTKDVPLVQNRESNALKWFMKDDPLPTNERSVTRMAEKWVYL